jgi:photosystem II stability/assembly factor-like uncharacterized protein
LLRTFSISPARLSALALLFSLALVLFPGISQGQDPLKGWQWQNPLPQGNAINSIKFASDKRHGWAVGSDGVILATTNGGFDWDQQESPANTTLYSIYLRDRNHLVVAGARGLILTTKNGGSKWTERKTGTRDHLFALTFAPDNPLHGWAVGTFGAIIGTTDGGVTWKPQTSNTTAHLFSVAFESAKNGIAAGSRGSRRLAAR